MTERFQGNSLLTPTWWKNNSFMWYIMALVSVFTGIRAYATFAQGGKGLDTSGYDLFFLTTLLIFCSALAAFSHLRAHPQAAQVNLKIIGILLASTAAAAAFCIVVTAPELLTLACFLATAFLLGISLKNAFVRFWQHEG